MQWMIGFMDNGALLVKNGVKTAILLGCALALLPAWGQAPDNPPTAAEIRRLIDTGHSSEALAQIHTLRSDGLPHAGVAVLAGLAEFNQGNLQAADQEFASALKEHPDDREAIEMRGLTLVKLGRPADAIPLLETVAHDTSRGLGKADPNYALALCYIDTRRYDDARHAFAAQFGFPPDGAQAYLLAARMLLRREFVPVSLEFAQKALALDSSLPGAHQLIGEIALAQGRTDDAIRELQQERTRSPLDGSVYDRLGDALYRAGRYDDAQRSLQEALLLEPNATGPFILLGKTLLKRSDAVGAATYLEHAAQMDPANYMTHSLLGQAYRAMGRTDQARHETELAEKLQHANEPQSEGAH